MTKERAYALKGLLYLLGFAAVVICPFAIFGLLGGLIFYIIIKVCFDLFVRMTR